MENHLVMNKSFYLLGTDIFKFLSLSPENRTQDHKLFLEEKFNLYQKLIENSNVIQKNTLSPFPLGYDISKTSSTFPINESSSLASNEEIV